MDREKFKRQLTTLRQTGNIESIAADLIDDLDQRLAKIEQWMDDNDRSRREASDR